jgi:uncharacterized GH25 family protein
MKLIKNIALAAVLSLSSLSAHSLWVNSFESFSHKPGHTTIGLGWGHSLPIDDMLNSPNGKVIVEEFSITDPKGNKTALKIPSNEVAQVQKETNSFDIYNSDVGLQKIVLKKESPKGLYKIEAKSKPTFYTVFIDNKDRQRMKLKSIDKLKNIKKVLMSVKYQAFAHSYLTLGDKWEEPKATNQGLEIIPKTDLSNLKVGDLVEFEVLFYGKPLSSGMKGTEYITANSSSFGQGHKFSLFSKIKNGKAQFIVQSSGQWKVECGHKNKITKDGKLKSLHGKANILVNVATLTFNVK